MEKEIKKGRVERSENYLREKGVMLTQRRKHRSTEAPVSLAMISAARTLSAEKETSDDSPAAAIPVLGACGFCIYASMKLWFDHWV